MCCSKCGVLNAKSSTYCYSCGSELVHKKEGSSASSDSSMTSSMENDSGRGNYKPDVDDASLGQKGSSGMGGGSVTRDTREHLSDGLRFVIALISCFGVYVVYVIIGVFVFEWKRGGGVIPMLIMFSIMGYVWRAIMGGDKKKDK